MAALLGRGGAFRGLVDRLAAVALSVGRGTVPDAATSRRAGPRRRRLRVLPGAVARACSPGVRVPRGVALRGNRDVALSSVLSARGSNGATPSASEALVVLSRHLLPFLPGGLGVQELGYTALLAGVGCDVERAASLVVLKRLREATWIAVGALALAGAGSRWARPGMPVTA